MYGGIAHMKHSEEAKKAQQTSLAGAYQLSMRCLQAFAFLQLLDSCDLSELLKK
jgi:hypothetical protein